MTWEIFETDLERMDFRPEVLASPLTTPLIAAFYYTAVQDVLGYKDCKKCSTLAS